MKDAMKAQLDGAAPTDFDAIVDDLAALRRDFAALVSQMKSGALKGANGTTQNTLDELGEGAKRLYDSVAAQGTRAVKAIDRQVEEQPVTSFLIAFGVGFIASRLLVR